MPVHDWTRVEAGIYHGFHLWWIAKIGEALNGGLLPAGFYACRNCMPDGLSRTFSRCTPARRRWGHYRPFRRRAGPPWPRRRRVRVFANRSKRRQLVRRRSVAVRHVSGHRLVALLEIVSPANKDRRQTVDDFAVKVVDALDVGIHVVVVNLFPPGPYDPQGMHGAIRQRLVQEDDSYQLPADEPLMSASYVAAARVDIYLEQLSVGDILPEMPLFVTQQRYVNLPLETTYQAAYQGMPSFWRGVLEGKQNL